MTDQAILLEPGFFGFGAFGKPPDAIVYFDEVAQVLHAATGIDLERIVVHEPEPTGPLAVRVAGLYEHVQKLLREGLAGRPVERLHLIGHSTGGVDIRLLANAKYLWPDGPCDEARTSFLSKIGTLVALSAPHRGTPIARRLRGALELAVVPLTLMSILAKSGSVGIGDKTAVAYASLKQLADGREIGERPLEWLGGMPEEMAAEVLRFLDHIRTDRTLIHDLTPFAMARLNDAIDGGGRAPVLDFVSVAPPPTVKDYLRPDLAWLQRGLYAASYEASVPDENEELPFPSGRWVGPHAELASDEASDGVVPSGSQAYDGCAQGIVEGDHLDVVGHFDAHSWRGATVFKSEANFDKERFTTLWTTIAKTLD